MSEKIILLKDFYDLKEQKEKELKFYREKMRDLEENLFWVEKELNLTKRIINMIEQDKITKI